MYFSIVFYLPYFIFWNYCVCNYWNKNHVPAGHCADLFHHSELKLIHQILGHCQRLWSRDLFLVWSARGWQGEWTNAHSKLIFCPTSRSLSEFNPRVQGKCKLAGLDLPLSNRQSSVPLLNNRFWLHRNFARLRFFYSPIISVGVFRAFAFICWQKNQNFRLIF